MNTWRSMHASRSGCRGFACAFASRPTHAQGGARHPFVAFECMCFPRRGIDASPTIGMVEGRFGLFAMGCGEGRRACAVLRSRACTAPEIRGSTEALRQSPYTFADMPTTRATCVAAFRTVRVRQHGLQIGRAHV